MSSDVILYVNGLYVAPASFWQELWSTPDFAPGIRMVQLLDDGEVYVSKEQADRFIAKVRSLPFAHDPVAGTFAFGVLPRGGTEAERLAYLASRRALAPLGTSPVVPSPTPPSPGPAKLPISLDQGSPHSPPSPKRRSPRRKPASSADPILASVAQPSVAVSAESPRPPDSPAPPLGLIIVCLLMLLAAVSLDLPIGFYVFLRFVVTGTSAWLAIALYHHRMRGVLVMAGLALFFNPLVPVYLGTKTAWLPFDLSAAVLICMAFVMLRRVAKARAAV